MSFRVAMKATYGEITHPELKEDNEEGVFGGYYYYKDPKNHSGVTYVSKEYYNERKGKSLIESREIFKDPITDDGTKKSKKGLLMIVGNPETGDLQCIDQCTKEEEETGLLETVFENGTLTKVQTLEEIRERIRG